MKRLENFKFSILPAIIAVPLVFLFFLLFSNGVCDMSTKETNIKISLPKPLTKGSLSFEETLLKRRSIRNFSDKEMTMEQLSKILWAAQGITSNKGFRSSPSAGGLYPLEVYVITGNIDGISPGIYHYHPASHSLSEIVSGDMRSQLSTAGLSQKAIKTAPMTLLFIGIIERTQRKYGKRAGQYVFIEAGHAGQNVLLQAVSLGLGAVPIGAFYEDKIRRILGVDDQNYPLYLIPVGYPLKQ